MTAMSNPVELSISKRLKLLHNTQGSIERTSRALLKLKHLAKDIVKVWFKEFRLADDKQKLAFLHLANDIIQNGMESAPQFAKLFEPVLPPAFRETARLQSHAIRSAVAHLLMVWADRQVYPRNFLRQLRGLCQRAAAQADGDIGLQARSSIGASPFSFSFTSALVNASARRQPNQSGNSEMPAPSETSNQSPVIGVLSACPEPPFLEGTAPSHQALTTFREELNRGLQMDAVKVPNTGDLIKLLESLQFAPSSDVGTRQAIADFPSEVSDPQMALNKIDGDRNLADEMREKIGAAVSQLEAYNRRLEEEMTLRSQVGLNLRAYRQHLQDSTNETRASINEMTLKRDHIALLKRSIEAHIVSLPDISLRPDQTSRLDPLPSVCELFR